MMKFQNFPIIMIFWIGKNSSGWMHSQKCFVAVLTIAAFSAHDAHTVAAVLDKQSLLQFWQAINELSYYAPYGHTHEWPEWIKPW